MSFAEILVIFIVALLVIKPERLPEISLALRRMLMKIRKLCQEVYKKTDY